ncbi:MAG: hypothetical protein ACKVUT_13140 [Gaiella sp.]
MSEAAQTPSREEFDNPLERLELLAGDDDAIARFLDAIDVSSPRERQMLTELARTTTVAKPDAFDQAHRRAVAALETLARHGFRGSRAAGRAGPFRFVARFFIQLIGRYIVVSYVRTAARSMRNLYYLREIQSPSGSRELQLLRPARFDANAMTETIFRDSEIGLPSFLIGGLLLPAVLSIGRLTGVLDSTLWAAVIGVIGALIALLGSWVVLRGTAMASKRIRLTATEPMRVLWETVGNCGAPPKDQSRTFAIVATAITVAWWVVIPALIGIAFALD